MTGVVRRGGALRASCLSRVVLLRGGAVGGVVRL